MQTSCGVRWFGTQSMEKLSTVVTVPNTQISVPLLNTPATALVANAQGGAGKPKKPITLPKGTVDLQGLSFRLVIKRGRQLHAIRHLAI